MKMTPEMILYITLAAQNLIAAVISKAATMSDEELKAGTAEEEAKSVVIMAELNSH